MTSLTETEAVRSRLVSRTWVQLTALVLLCGLAILGFLGYRAYTADPPIAAQVRTSSGQVVYTRADVIAGQKLFLGHGLMEYGSIFGHGAYLGPDFTADYLHRAALIATREYGGGASSSARDKVVADFKTNRYDPKADTVRRAPRMDCCRKRLLTRSRSSNSPRISPGRRGLARRCGRTRTTPTPTTGRRSRWSATL